MTHCIELELSYLEENAEIQVFQQVLYLLMT